MPPYPIVYIGFIGWRYGVFLVERLFVWPFASISRGVIGSHRLCFDEYGMITGFVAHQLLWLDV